MNTEQMRARWYSVDATGMATLCRDEADAIKTAADNSIMWPNLAPHKAVQLIEARAALTHPQETARVGGVPEVYTKAIDVLLDFAQTVGGSSSFWDDVWPEHEAALAYYHEQMLTAAPQAPADVVRDAERYRWLAAHCRSTSEHWGGRWSIIVDGPAPQSHDSEDDFDAAIDAAMSTKAGEKA